MTALRCPTCGSRLSPLLEYTGHAYSEHRDFTGMECDNYECLAEWDKRGDVTVESKVAVSPSATPVGDTTCGTCANSGWLGSRTSGLGREHRHCRCGRPCKVCPVTPVAEGPTP